MQKRKNRRKIARYILIPVSILVVLGLAFFWFLHSAEKPIKKDEQAALDRISGSVDLKSHDDFYLYNGPKETYYVLTGKNKAGKDIIVWVPKKKSGEVLVKYASDGISEQQARDIVQKEKKPRKILNVTLGMEEGVPIWEVSYLDKNDNLGYYDMSFSEGEWLRQIENL
ncbi:MULTISPECIES: DUF5590 domain-containing protein [Listeria]|uniref:cell wall elongation regulator TseB-like domain-containing protein n=1 Tax=Listeria TaxID=1637 RepID=UPI000B589720|nr:MULTISPECIES: DUF5590 domain-containing protein [Listeria]